LSSLLFAYALAIMMSSVSWCDEFLLFLVPAVGIDNPLVQKTDTQGTENLDKAISLDQEGASMCSLPLCKHASTKWLTVAAPYIPDTIVPAPHLGFVQVKVHKLSRLAKRLGGWVRACSLAGNGVVQKMGRRSKDT
jgi:hypothetical protein